MLWGEVCLNTPGILKHTEQMDQYWDMQKGRTQMLKKPLVRWLSLLLIVIAVIGVMVVSAAEPTPKASGLVLEDMPIVLPANATDVEKTAAKELQHYLKEMTGKNASVIIESGSMDSAIYIGATKFNAEANVTWTDEYGMGEGWAVKAIGENLVIAGGEQRGVLYAVYHLLEDHFGIHWWNMWEEYVPEMADAVVPYDFAISGEPKFAYRDIYTKEAWTSLYYVRNRLNGFASNAPVEYGDEENFGRPYHVHTFNRYFPPYYEAPTSEKWVRWHDAMNPDHVDWFVEHPEWFSYSEAEQKRISYGQMCLTNEELLEAFIEKAILAVEMSYEDAELNGTKRPKYYSISANDGTEAHCGCPDCKASIAASGLSGHLLKFVNKIADALHEVYPEIKVETLAYSTYLAAPLDDTVPADNVIIRLANSDLDLAHDLNHPNNKEIYDRIQDWADITQPGQLWLWDYGVTLSQGGVLPNYFRWFNDYKYCHEQGFMGIFTEHQRPNYIEFWDLKEWLMAKAMEDPYQDVEELAMTFLRGYYGEAAADSLYGYLRYMEEATYDYYSRTRYGSNTLTANWLDAQEVLQAMEYFEAAVAGIEADKSLSDKDRELYLNRINAARTRLDDVVLTNFNRFAEEASAAGITFDVNQRETAARLYDSLLWLRAMEPNDYTGLDTYKTRVNMSVSEEMDGRYTPEMDPATGEILERPAIPQQIYDENPGISDNHIHQFLASNFDVSTSVAYPFIDLEFGAASWGKGYALTLDYGELMRWSEDYLSSISAYTISETKAMSGTVGGLTLGDPLINDGEYHLYRAEDVIVRSGSTTTFKLFGTGAVTFSTKDLLHLVDDPVDVYISMKIEGDPSGENPNKAGKLYVDRVFFVEDCISYDITYTSEIPATCGNNYTQIGTCPVCGKEARKETPYTKLYHDLTSGYRYDAATGKYHADCALCGDAVFDTLGELPQDFVEMLETEGIPMETIYDFGVDSFTVSVNERTSIIKDADSALGKTVFWDLTDLPESSHFSFRISNTKRMFFARSIVKDAPTAKELILDGDYHLYKLSDVPLVTKEDSRLIFFNWTLQLNAEDLQHLRDRKVDIYFSFKVDGDLDHFVNGVGDHLYYYIDRIIIVAGCENHYADSSVWDETQNAYVGKCATCHREVKQNISSALPQQVEDDLNAMDAGMEHVIDVVAGSEFATNGALGFNRAVAISDTYCFVEDDAATEDWALKIGGDKWANKNIYLTLRNTDKTSKSTATITMAEIKNTGADGKYHLYKATLTAPEPNADGSKGLRLYASDYMQIFNGLDNLSDAAGETVNFYISMRYEATADGTPSVYYVDRVILTTDCDGYLTETGHEDPTCWHGDIYNCVCSICGKETDIEDEMTRLAHDYGPYALSADGKTQIAYCRNEGCEEPSIIAVLPQEVMDDLNAAGAGIEHVIDITADSFNHSSYSGRAFVTDPDTGVYVLKATGCNPKSMSVSVANFGLTPTVRTDVTIPKTELDKIANDGKYHTFKLEDVVVPPDRQYIYAFSSRLRITEGLERLNAIAGSTVDMYVSLKYVVDEDDNSIFYIDRFVVMDSCDDYEIEYELPEGITCMDTTAEYTGACPICKKVKTQEGEVPTLHSFTKYVRDKYDTMKYTATCDYGCGTTDVKYDEYRDLTAILPEQLPETARNHLLFSYDVHLFNLSGMENCYYWDLELDRPVGVINFENSPYSDKYYTFTATEGIYARMYSREGSVGGGGRLFNVADGTGVVKNAGKGYQLYVLEDVTLVSEGEYNYFYMMESWVLQVDMMDDDLIAADYRDKPVDVYLYMKVEGDPTVWSADSGAAFYFDQIIVAGSCTTDETWTVTKEATCSENGEMVGTCTTCGLESRLVTPRLAHTMSNTVLSSKATCTKNETRYGRCDVCGTSTTITIPDTKLGHVFTKYEPLENGIEEAAWCDNGCKARDVRPISQPMAPGEVLENSGLQQLLPIFGAAGGREFGFSDIKTTDWYFESVKNAWENKLIDGVSATEYRPNDTLTVAQAVKLASAYHERYNTGDVTLTNGAGSWYSSYVDYAVENGIIDSKYSSYTNAQMNKTIDRSEFVAIFEKAMDEEELVGYNTVSDNAIPDVKMDDDNADAIYKFYRAGILTGSDGKGTFNPGSSIKRSEVAAILSRMFDSNVRQSITLN